MNDKKQSILIVHNFYQIPGGEDTVVSNEKEILEDNGHSVVLYTRNNSELKEMLRFQKMLFPFTMIFSLKTYRNIKRIIKEQNIDIVHIHNTTSLISPSVYYAALSCKKPVVQTIHNFRLLCPGANFYREGHICEDCVEKGLKCAVKHNCYRNSRLQTLACVINTKIHRMTGIYGRISYICLTQFNKEKLLNLKQIKPGQVFVKPNFVDSGGNVIPYEKRENQVVFAGRLDRLKGIDLLLEAWRELKETKLKLVICGIGPMEKWCQNYIKENNMLNVEMKGFVSNKQVREIIANSKALILPTRLYEGVPMTIIEAYSVGTPVLGSDIGNAGSLIEEGITGYKLVHDSVECLTNAILNSNLRICESTKAAYDQHYTKEKNYKQQVEIYTKVQKLMEKQWSR